MSSVKDELVEELVEEYGCSQDEAYNAVNRAIEANQNDDRFGEDIQATAEMIYTNQKFWEPDEKPIEKD